MKLFAIFLFLISISLSNSIGEDESTSLPDLNIELTDNEDRIFYHGDTSGQKRKEIGENIPMLDLNIELFQNEDGIFDEGETNAPSRNNNIILTEDETYLDNLNEKDRESRIRKRKSKFEKETSSPYGHAPILYLLSRFCYEIRFSETNFTQIAFSRLIYGDSAESVTFRTNFQINAKDYNGRKKFLNKIEWYFNRRSDYKRQKCLDNITEKEAKNNIMYWKTKVENHPNFEELKDMGDRIFPSTNYDALNEGVTPIKYLRKKDRESRKRKRKSKFAYSFFENNIL